MPPRCTTRANRSTHAVTAVMTAISLGILAAQSEFAHAHDLLALFPLAGLMLLSRALPVAVVRGKSLTFCAVFVFAGAMLLGSGAAGLCAMLICAAMGAITAARPVRPRWPSAAAGLATGGRYALAAAASRAVLGSQHEFRYDVSGGAFLWRLTAAAVVFTLSAAILSGIAQLAASVRERRDTRSLLVAYAVVYAVGMPFAVLLVIAYRAFGAGAAPALATVLLVCAHAVRMTIDNRALVRQLRSVEALGRSCASGVREEMPLGRFLGLARGLVAFDRAIVWLSDEGTTHMRARVAWPAGEPLPDAMDDALDTLCLRAADRGEPLLRSFTQSGVGDPSTFDGEHWMVHPLLLHGRCVGLAQFVREGGPPFGREDVARLNALVPQAAVALESVRARYLMHRYQDLVCHYQDMARKDGLTGLLNHRRCQEVLRDEVARAERYGRPLSVLMMDVDSFKQFNDTYGHPLGDLLLRGIARILRETVRSTDHGARYGGEEFMVILPETSGEDACVLAERIRQTVAAEWFPAGEQTFVQKTVSIGVASYPAEAATATELLYCADMALYRAKRSGKNRVLAGATVS